MVNLTGMARQIAKRKVHFAPLTRQQREIDRLVRAGRHQNVTEFMRAAIDHYLDSIGRPPLSQQAREMAEEYAGRQDRDADRLQARAMETEETW
jgi:Arc/MetJ-type ribon-helix-helix transcriptional regulator